MQMPIKPKRRKIKMAKNWTVKEALEALKSFDKLAIADFGKRFPIATAALMKAGVNATELVSGLPDHVSMRKVESKLKGDIEDTDSEVDETEDDVEEETPKAKRGRKGAKSEEEKRAAAKARREARKAKAKAAEAEEDEDEEDEEESDNSYDGMNAVELFKLCKKRGIKAEPKQKSSVYIDLLEAADKKMGKGKDEEDDWEDEDDDEEEVMPAPKKGRGRPAKAKDDKPAKSKKPVDDEEDDDWDI